jgi:hypothetical protein
MDPARTPGHARGAQPRAPTPASSEIPSASTRTPTTLEPSHRSAPEGSRHPPQPETASHRRPPWRHTNSKAQTGGGTRSHASAAGVPRRCGSQILEPLTRVCVSPRSRELVARVRAGSPASGGASGTTGGSGGNSNSGSGSGRHCPSATPRRRPGAERRPGQPRLPRRARQRRRSTASALSCHRPATAPARPAATLTAVRAGSDYIPTPSRDVVIGRESATVQPAP